MLRFDDRVVIVTGAAGGLGREYALLLGSLGARVVVNDYGGDLVGTAGSPDHAAAVAAEIIRAGGDAIADGSDVRETTAGERIVAAAIDRWGRVDAVINNAAATRGGVGISGCTSEDLLFTLDIHLGGTFRLARAAWPHMLERSYGRIVNTASDALWGAPVPSYLAAKGAIFGLSRALAAEANEYGIKVNTVMPSAWTRMTADIPPGEFRDTVQREFRPAGVAPMVALLAHQDCPCNGETFQVGAHRAARVFMGVTPGFQAAGEAPIDELADNYEQIVDLDAWTTPRDMIDSVALAVSHLGAQRVA